MNIFEDSAEALAEDVLETFLAWLRRSKRMPMTISCYVAGGRSLWKYLCRRDLVPPRFRFEKMRDNLADALGRVRYRAPRPDRRLPLVVAYVEGLPMPSANRAEMAARLCAAREAKRLSQAALAALAGLHEHTVWECEAGRDIFDTSKRKLTQALGIDPAELFAREVSRLTLLRDKALLRLLFCSAMRREEVSRLNRADLEDGHATQAIILGKGDKERVAFFDDKALAAIRAYLEVRGDDHAPLFLRHDNRRGAPGPKGENWRLLPQSVWGIVRRYGKLAGVEAGPHDFRHLKATTLLNRGAKLEEVQDILGHESPDTTKRIYAHYDVGHLRRAFDRYSVDVDELIAELGGEQAPRAATPGAR